MEQTPRHRSASSEFTFDPTNKVVGSIDAAPDAKDALRDLRAAGFTAKEVELLTDEEGARRIGMSGVGQEVIAHVFDSTQKVPAFYDAPGIVRRVEQELQGRSLLDWSCHQRRGNARASARDTEISRRTLHQLLRAMGRGGVRAVIPLSS